MLKTSIFQQIIQKLQFFPDVDLFASRRNHQVDNYVSWTPDPDSMSVDAFSVSWSNIKFFAYPPFSMVGAAISKIVQDQATGIMIIPYWTSQYNAVNACEGTYNSSPNQNTDNTAIQPRSQTSFDTENKALGSTPIQRCIADSNFSAEVSQII